MQTPSVILRFLSASFARLLFTSSALLHWNVSVNHILLIAFNNSDYSIVFQKLVSSSFPNQW